MITYKNRFTGVTRKVKEPSDIEIRTENDAQAQRHQVKLITKLDESKKWERVTRSSSRKTEPES